MKKLFILFSMLILCFPIYVFGATGIFWYNTENVGYYAYVSNENGANASCYVSYDEEMNILVPYLSKIKVSNEFFINGKLYASFDYKDTTCDISLDDISVANGNKLELEFSSFERVIYKDIYLYEGPAYVYEKVIKVPAWTKLKITYSDDMWGYTEYNGKKGWFNILSYESAYDYSDYSGSLYDIHLNYILNNDLQLVSSPFNNDKVVGIIPKGTEIKINYYLSSGNGISYYVEYGDIKGWINKVDDYVGRTAEIYDDKGFEILAMKGGSIFSLKNLDIYSDVDKTTIIGNIPKYTSVALNYHIFNKNNSKDYLYINYNGVSGWVIDEDINEEKEDDILKNYPEIHAAEMYASYILSDDIQVKNISTNEKENIKKGEIVYIGYENCDDEECSKDYLYYNSNSYEYVDFDGEYFNNFQEEPDLFEPIEKGEDKKFVFDVNVPTEVLNAKIFGVDFFLDDNLSTESDDVISTISDDAFPKKEDDGIIDILMKIPIIYYIIGGSVFVLIIAILVIVVIKNKNIVKVEEGIIANNEVFSNVTEDNVMPSETISQEQSDNNKTQL